MTGRWSAHLSVFLGPRFPVEVLSIAVMFRFQLSIPLVSKARAEDISFGLFYFGILALPKSLIYKYVQIYVVVYGLIQLRL